MTTTNTNLHYAKKLYLLRRVSDRKQADVAEHLGISQQAYSKLEHGETSFTDEVIDKICQLFDVPVEEFVQSDEKINCINSPHAVNNGNNNSQINSVVTEQILLTLLEEIKQSREERKVYLKAIESLITKN